MRHLALTLSLVVFYSTTSGISAQVTTATLYGVVRDSTASSLPGALVSVSNQGTGLSREAVTDVSGEFALTAGNRAARPMTFPFETSRCAETSPSVSEP